MSDVQIVLCAPSWRLLLAAALLGVRVGEEAKFSMIDKVDMEEGKRQGGTEEEEEVKLN